MASYDLMMDVGGTGIKCGILDESGNLRGSVECFPARSGEDREQIFENFAGILNHMKQKLPLEKSVFHGIGMAFPGPFDYERGISLMRGLQKYDAIYGVPIGEELLKYTDGEKLFGTKGKLPIWFLHDVEAFALGESGFGAAAGCRRIFCLCMGTGAGSAFLEQGKIKKEGPGVPKDGWIYDTPFRDGQIDDYLSVRGLRRLAAEEFTDPPEGSGLYRLAAAGDERARRVFRKFGGYLLKAVRPFLQEFAPEGMILGGRISQSFPFFGGALEAYCRERQIGVFLSEDTSVRTFQGLFLGRNIR